LGKGSKRGAECRGNYLVEDLYLYKERGGHKEEEGADRVNLFPLGNGKKVRKGEKRVVRKGGRSNRECWGAA